MKDNVYESKTLNQLILLFGVPSILALLIETLTGVTDTAFAGNLPGIGDMALSSMALISPLLSIFTALQTLFAMSSGILVAKYFNNKESKRNSILVSVIMSIVVSTVASLICNLFLTEILELIGAKGEIAILATKYMKIQLFSNIVSSVGYTLTCIIRSLGHPKLEMLIITIAVIANIFFNALFSFGFKMGIQGLAWGTFISEVICSLISGIFILRTMEFQKCNRIRIKEFFALAKEMFKIGAAQTLIQALGGCTGFFVNSQLLILGNNLSVAAWSIAQRIYMIVLMPIVGLTQGVQSIIAYFNGQEDKTRVKRVSSLTQKYAFIYGLLGLVLVILFGNNFIVIFGNNEEILMLAKTILMIIFSSFPLVGVFYTNITLLQVTGREISSVMLVLTRQLLLIIPLLFLMPVLFSEMGLPKLLGIFVSMPLADLLVVITSIILSKNSLKIYGNNKYNTDKRSI